MGMFTRKKPAPNPPPPPTPSIPASDLVAAEKMMDRWDASLGNNDATWDCLDAIARLGGFRGPKWALQQGSSEAMFWWWRWWQEAARLAHDRGQDRLVGRIFLFTHLFAKEMAPKMDAKTMFVTGLTPPPKQVYESIATLAVDSMSRMDPALMIHDTAAGAVCVLDALSMAREVAGLPAQDPQPPGAHTPIVSDGSQWN